MKKKSIYMHYESNKHYPKKCWLHRTIFSGKKNCRLNEKEELAEKTVFL